MIQCRGRAHAHAFQVRCAVAQRVVVAFAARLLHHVGGLGTGRVIRGWDEGIEGMRRGGKRELQIPAWLGYGKDGAGRVIPPGASLVFEVDLLDIRK